MNKPNVNLKWILKIFLGVLSLISKIILQIILWVLTPISKVVSHYINKIHLSIILKLNLFYGIGYVLFFGGSYYLTYYIYINYLKSLNLPVENLLMILSVILIISIVVFFIIFLCLGRLGAKSILSPIHRLNNAIKTTDANQLQNRLDITGTNDELKELAQTFNHMMDRLENFINKQKQFVSDASHELRTPIAVIQGYANLLNRWGKDDPAVLEESILAIKQETDNMKDLVEKLLFLARSDKQTQVVNKEIIDLSELAVQVVKETSFIDDEHIIKSQITPQAIINGDKNLIKELMRILIDNALKYTPEEGTITITVKCTHNTCILSVKDTGIGIDSKHLSYIFERFYRIDEARTSRPNSGGTGLGLAIAKWIIEVHDAQVYVSSQLHKGTEFLIFFNTPTK